MHGLYMPCHVTFLSKRMVAGIAPVRLSAKVSVFMLSQVGLVLACFSASRTLMNLNFSFRGKR